MHLQSVSKMHPTYFKEVRRGIKLMLFIMLKKYIDIKVFKKSLKLKYQMHVYVYIQFRIVFVMMKTSWF